MLTFIQEMFSKYLLSDKMKDDRHCTALGKGWSFQ